MTAPPKQARSIRSELDALIANAIELGIGDDSNFSILRQAGSLWEVTFDGADYVSIAMADIEYGDIYDELAAKRSYNVKLIDGGLLQLMYMFAGDRLLQHRLAYFPSPSLRPFRDDPESYLRDDLYIEIVSRRVVAFPVRFDFDDREGVHVELKHPRSHLTLGDVEGCRVPVTAGVTPRWFFEFIIRNFYQNKIRDLAAALPNHAINLPRSITERESKIIHIAVPEIV